MDPPVTKRLKMDNDVDAEQDVMVTDASFESLAERLSKSDLISSTNITTCSPFNSPIFTLLVGPTSQKFLIHELVLSQSPILARMIGE